MGYRRMTDYYLMEREFLEKEFIENNLTELFSDIQNYQRRDIKKTSNKFGAIRNFGESLLQRIYTLRGVSISNKEQERIITESH